MATLFIYGTLQHIPLLEIVLGRPADSLGCHDDLLPDYAVFTDEDGDIPVLLPKTGDDAHGKCLTGLTDDDMERLDAFEAVFGYEPRVRALRSGLRARVYYPPGVEANNHLKARWSLARWVGQWAQLSCFVASEVMKSLQDENARSIAANYSRIRARAQSRLNARNSRHGAGTLHGQVQVHARTRSYSNFFALDELRLRHERFDGTLSPVLERAVFVTTDAALVLPYDPWTDQVLLVEQIRMRPLARDDTAVWHMEPVAGLIDPGETPETTARRECLEEAGCELMHIEPVSEGYSSPGASTDFQYIFVGICYLFEQARHGGLADEGEDIRTHVMPFSELMEMTQTAQVGNTPLALLAYWLSHHRGRLRSEYAGDKP